MIKAREDAQVIREVHLSDEVIYESLSEKDARFDAVVGELEDLLMDDTFVRDQERFMDQYCHEFEEKEENKLIYTDIFNRYKTFIETKIEQKLKSKLPWFDMNEFSALIHLGDFQAFKELMLSHKQQKEGRGFDLGGLIIQSSARR